MKFILTFLIIFGVAFNCKSQDTIFQKNGETIKSQVIEVTQVEIKYKRFDNKTGPTYTLNKSDVTMIKYENGTKDVFNQATTNSKCNIYFIRDDASKKARIKVRVLIDQMLVCGLDRNSYSVHSIKAGKHNISAEYGLARKKNTEITTEPDKNYYIRIIYKIGAIVCDIYCVEIDETLAVPILPSLKINSECKL
jgi:hypothetical protein